VISRKSDGFFADGDRPASILGGRNWVNFSLTPHLEAMIREKVASGRYASSSEVVREALRLLDEHDKREHLRAAIEHAKESVARGDVHSWTPKRLSEIWERTEAAAVAGESPNPDVCPDGGRRSSRDQGAGQMDAELSPQFDAIEERPS
jgi:antitoxin ParD1/3/4